MKYAYNTTSDNPILWNNNSGNDSLDYDYDPYLIVNIPARVKQFLSDPHMIIMLVLGCIAITLNVMSLLALFQVRSRVNSHYRLIISLSAADTLVGLSILLHIINKVFNPVFNPVGFGNPQDRVRARCIFMLIKGLNTTALNISLLNLVGMSIDHYMAINKPLHYPEFMNKKRVKVMVIILWIVSIFCGFSVFISGIFTNSKYRNRLNYCEIASITGYQEEFIMIAIAIICLFVMLYIYIQIYRVVQKHRSPGETLKNDERKNRRALITTLLILGSFMLCWLPTCIFQTVMIIKVSSGPTKIDSVLVRLYNADKYLYDLLLLNSICDPIIYTVRTFEVQLGYRRLFAGCFGNRYLDRKAHGASLYTRKSLIDKKGSNNSSEASQKADFVENIPCTIVKTTLLINGKVARV